MESTDIKAFGYSATRDGAGVLTIHRVPIFVECKRGETTFDGKWIAAAVAKAKQSEAEGYLPPLHVRHHEDGLALTDNVRAAGFFRITGVEPITFKGTRRMAVFADLVITDPGVSMDVLAKRLPYRSVEIFDVTAPAIDSLALLDHEAPYLELPMLMVAEVEELAPGIAANGGPSARPCFAGATFVNPWRGRPSTSDEPVVAFFRRGQSAHLLTEDHMEPKTTNENPNGAKFADGKDGGGDAKSKGEDKPKGDSKEGKDKGASMEGGPDVKAVVKAIEDGSISVADMDAIMAAIQTQRSKSEQKPAEDNPTTSAPAPAAAPGEAMKKGPMDEALAKVAGENAALRARLDERDATDQRRTDVAAALKRLDGRPLGSDLEDRLVKFHKDHGPKAFAAYVDSVVQTFGALAGTDDENADAFAEQTKNAPETAVAFAELGSDAVAKATKFSREWADLNERGLVRMSEARYVEINMERAGVKLAKKRA